MPRAPVSWYYSSQMDSTNDVMVVTYMANTKQPRKKNDFLKDVDMSNRANKSAVRKSNESIEKKITQDTCLLIIV